MSVVRRVVLDTCVLRSTSAGDVDALRTRGFAVSLPMFAVSEAWAAALRDGAPGKAFGPISRVLPRLDPELPFVLGPAHLGQQANALNVAARKRFAAEHRARSTKLRDRLVYELGRGICDAAFHRIGELLDKGLNELADQWVESLQEMWAREVNPAAAAVPEPEMLKRSLLRFGSHYHERPERFDAQLRVMFLLIIRAARHQGKQPQPNDIEDVGMLGCIAAPAFLATSDVRLLSLVDESDSYQAPWVRTVPELLTAELPRGVPWGESAKRAHRTWKRSR
ncbi:hypothetical protein [Sorangium sp. So ce204]|uniref:hypothetical protein n=1 Tax=Sorangium sp. So ce204 TaxID=3133288 RepID=UPI003F628E17